MRHFCLSLTLFLAAIGGIFSTVHAQINVTTNIVPTNTTLVWEAESYTPPFYKGKALYPTGGAVRVVAFPPEGIESPETLSYKWKVDGEVQGDVSGIGRQTFLFPGNLVSGSPLVVVEVSSNEGVHGIGVARVPTTALGVLLYHDAPLLGVLFNHAFTAASSNEIALEAYPLFFSTQTRNTPQLTHTWSANNVPLQNPSDIQGRLVIRTETPGTTTLSVVIENNDRILERSRGDVTVYLSE